MPFTQVLWNTAVAIKTNSDPTVKWPRLEHHVHVKCSAWRIFLTQPNEQLFTTQVSQRLTKHFEHHQRRCKKSSPIINKTYHCDKHLL